MRTLRSVWKYSASDCVGGEGCKRNNAIMLALPSKLADSGAGLLYRLRCRCVYGRHGVTRCDGNTVALPRLEYQIKPPP